MVSVRTVVAFAVAVATALLLSLLLWRRGACSGERARERAAFKPSAKIPDVEVDVPGSETFGGD